MWWWWCQVPAYPKGNFLAPTILTDVTPDMPCYSEEIFGPVLVCVGVETFDEAIALINRNPYGNGTALFTQSGSAARKYQSEIDIGQVKADFLSRSRPHIFCI